MTTYDPTKFLDFKLVQLRQMDRINDSSKQIYGESAYDAIKNIEVQLRFLEAAIKPFKEGVKGFQEKLDVINGHLDYKLLDTKEKHHPERFIEYLAEKYSFLIKNSDIHGIAPITESSLNMATEEQKQQLTQEEKQ